ncbi:hypothetical protein [Hyphococcus luteus]|nr:hypothetical protein [Marinicaulis flavus]
MSRNRYDRCAVAAALLAKVRWNACKLLSRCSHESAVERLFAHATELTLSPETRDQLLCAALSEAAHEVSAGRTVLTSPPTVFLDNDGKLETVRGACRNKVCRHAGDHWGAGLEQAAVFMQSQRINEKQKTDTRNLTKDLTEATVTLQRHIGDHPQIQADSNIRLVMFLSLSMVETRLRYDSGVSKSKHHIVVGQRPTVSVLKNVGRNLNSRFESVRRLSAN